MHIYWQLRFQMSSSLRGKCDWPATQSGLHPATLDVNKICLCIFFLSAQLVLRMQKHGATGSVLLHHTHTRTKKTTSPCCGHRWSLVKELQVWSAQLLSILVSSGQSPQALFRNFFIFLTVLRWKWRCGTSFARGELKVQGPDTWKSISRHLTFLGRNSLLRGFLFSQTCSMQVRKWEDGDEEVALSPPSLSIHWSF